MTEGQSGPTVATFTVTLSPTSTQTVTVAYATADGTATADSDYVAKSGTLTFAAGVSTRPISVTVNGDTTVESDETFSVTLSSPTNAVLGTATGAGTILTDDTAPSLPSLAIGSLSLTEGQSGTSAATFTVTLSPTSTQTVTVAYATADGTAAAGSDYVAKSGTLFFPAGVSTRPISVTVNGDTAVEPNETFSVRLSSPTNAVLGTASGTGTILTDDTSPGLPSLTSATLSLTEGNSGTTRSRFHGDPVARHHANRHGRVHDGERHGDGRKRLRSEKRHLDVPAWCQHTPDQRHRQWRHDGGIERNFQRQLEQLTKLSSARRPAPAPSRTTIPRRAYPALQSATCR